MKILSIHALEGPNVWCRLPVLETRIDLSRWREPCPAAFLDRLRDWLPSWTERDSQEPPRPALGLAAMKVGSISPGPGTCAAQVLLNVLRAVHARCRGPLRFGQVLETCDAEVHLLVVDYEEAALTRACLEFARDLCLAAVRQEEMDVAGGLRRLRELAEEVCLGTTTGALVAVARQRGIPVRRLDPISLVQLGHGSRQRRMRAALVDRTGVISEAISLDKDLTKSLLRDVGVPVPAGRPVRDREDAWRAACELGTPVAVKPRNGDYGLGVGLNLRTQAEICAAYDEARRYRDEVLVERYAAGAQHRVTVVGERVVAAVRRVAPHVTGDGSRTVRQLIDEANRDPRRGDDEDTALNRICPDEDTGQLLSEQGLSLDAVPRAGVSVTLSRLAHTWAGGEVLDVTEQVHPRTAAQCVRAAQVIGIDVAGLDLIADDLARPLEDQGGVVLEVNAGPAIALHFAPYCECPRPVCEAILERLFPAGQTGRIPTVLLAGPGSHAHAGRVLEHLLAGTAARIGRTASDGLYVGGCRIKTGDAADASGARALLMCSDVDLAIVEQSLERIRHEGLAVDRCDAAVLAWPDRYASSGEARQTEQVRAAEVLVESLDPQGSLVVDAELAVQLRSVAAYHGRLVIVSPAGDPPRIEAGRCAAQLRGVSRRGDRIVLWSRGGSEQVLAIHEACGSRSSSWSTTGLDRLRAVAAAWVWGVTPNEIQARLASLPPTARVDDPRPPGEHVPGFRTGPTLSSRAVPSPGAARARPDR